MLKALGLAAASMTLATVGAGVIAAPASAQTPSVTAATVSAPAKQFGVQANVPTHATAPVAPTQQAGKVGDTLMPQPPSYSHGTSGTVTFQLTNNTSQTVTFNVNVSSDAQNETTIGNNGLDADIYSTNPQVAPGQTVDVPITAGGGGLGDGSDPVVTVGLEGYAQFEMWVHVSTFSTSDFQNIEYKGSQTGGGDTGGLSQVNLGNGSVISNGNGGINNDWTYVNGTSAGFTVG